MSNDSKTNRIEKVLKKKEILTLNLNSKFRMLNTYFSNQMYHHKSKRLDKTIIIEEFKWQEQELIKNKRNQKQPHEIREIFKLNICYNIL